MPTSTWVSCDMATDVGGEAVVGAELVLQEDGECLVSQGTQTGEGSNLVQITASLPEMMQRIEAFMRFKRQQVNISNQLEFCPKAEGSGEGTCARTDAVYVKRGPHQSHISAYRVHNISGPAGPLLAPLEKLKQDLQPPSTWEHRRPQVRSLGLLGLQERIGSMEQYMDAYNGGMTPRNLLQRVRNLELRILQLEGQSPEYTHSEMTSPKICRPQRMHPYATDPSRHRAQVISHDHRSWSRM